MEYVITCRRPGQMPQTFSRFHVLTETDAVSSLKNAAFRLATTGRYGRYPSGDAFVPELMKGLSPNGQAWTSSDGTVLELVKI